MTYSIHTDRALGSASFWQRLSDLRADLGARRAQDRAYHRTVDELSALSNRDLLDMGIDRADIDTIARQVASKA